MSQIPVIDLFAGPGGLGEGFATHRKPSGNLGFAVALSVEKDPNAHETLTLRSFFRKLEHGERSAYWGYLSGAITQGILFEKYPRYARQSRDESLLLELGPQTADDVRRRVRQIIPKSEAWVLIGGPPCQAYSLAGRSRNRGNPNYEPEKDHRQTLYVEYLQILADHQPTVFVMENVKGLLSAALPSHRLFDRIRDDLSNPGSALAREGRKTSGRPRYKLYAIASGSRTRLSNSPKDFVVRSEEYGVPQARHRVIVLGVLEHSSKRDPDCLREAVRTPSVWDAIHDLPRLRGGITKSRDEAAAWLALMKTMPAKPWVRDSDPALREQIRRTATHMTCPRADRGANYLPNGSKEAVLNHSSRAHIPADLERYFFASNFAQVYERSPTLREFPSSLLPLHENVPQALADGLFHDRFRVQVKHKSATTVTSHISKDGHYYIHFDPSQCRSLTVREAARLQTFPDDYFFCGPRTSQYQQVGNAVPPKLAAQIAQIVHAGIG